MADIHRLRNPFEHWFSGFVVELVTFSVFVAGIYALFAVTIFIAKAL